MAAFPEGTIIGPVLEVRIVKILDEYGMEVAIPSIVRPVNTSYVVISRGTERFVNEIHDHKEELRSSSELHKEGKPMGKKEDPIAAWKLVLSMASRKLGRALPAMGDSLCQEKGHS